MRIRLNSLSNVKLSLSLKISLTVVGFIVGGALVTAYLVNTRTSTALKDSISASQSQLTRQSMDKVDRYLYERLVDIQVLSGRQQLQNYLTTKSQRTTEQSDTLIKQLNHFRIISGAWEDVTLIDTNNNPILTTSDSKTVQVLMQQSEFIQAFQKALGGEISYTDVFNEQGGNHPIMLFMAPLRDTSNTEQPIIGVVVGQLAWQSTLEILRSIQNITAELLNSKGFSLGSNDGASNHEILTTDHSKTAAFQQATTGAHTAQVLPGLESGNKTAQFVTSYVKESGYLDYSGNGWLLILQTPQKQAFAPVSTLSRELFMAFFGILIISVSVFLLFLNKQVLRPTLQLRDAVSRLARGDFSHRLKFKSQDEFGDLANAFNDMADKLQFAYNNMRETSAIAQRERSILQAILDNLPLGVFVAKAPSGEQIMINKAGLTLRSQGKTIKTDGHKQPDIEIIREDGSKYPDAELPLFITLKTSKMAIKDDLLVQKPDGTRLALRAISAPIWDAHEKLDSVVVVFEDITQEQELERSKEEFFSIASHELRTPLTAIRGNTSIIKEYLSDEIRNKDTREMIDDIHDSAIRLIEIVNDFLDTSRLEQGRMKFEFEAFDLPKIAHSVVSEFQVTTSRHKINLNITEPKQPMPQVFADQNRTKQILINLVGNALKFTDEGSITISFQVEKNMVKTLVKDTGKGMTTEAQQRLFKKFEQSGQEVLTRDSVRGTGLGLYISKLITEQMQGHIRLESSEVGVGTTFSFTLPLAGSDKNKV